MTAMPHTGERTLAQLPRLAHLAPPVIGPDATLEAVVDALSRDPAAGLAFVTGPDDRLLGGARSTRISSRSSFRRRRCPRWSRSAAGRRSGPRVGGR